MPQDAKLPNPALLAARNGLPDLVLAVLAHRVAPRIDLNERGPDGATAIGHLAQNKGLGESTPEVNRKAVAELIERGALVETFEPDFRDTSNWNRTTRAYELPTVHLALLCLRSSTGPWQPIFEKLGASRLRALCAEHPLLHEALRQHNRAAAEALLDAGADPDREDPELGLPLSNCLTPAAFSMMISRGAKMGARDAAGRSALQVVSAKTESREILAMAAAAAEAEARGTVASFKEGERLKGRASDDVAEPLLASLFDAVDAQNLERADHLWKSLDLGRHKPRLMAARDSKGRNLLHAAIEAHAFPLARKLLRLGMSPDVVSAGDATAFTSLLALSYDRKIERDKSRKRRAKFCAEVMAQVDWAARGTDGSTLYERLLGVDIESHNDLDVEPLRKRAAARLPDWLALEGEPPTCLLARALGVAVCAGRSGYRTLAYAQEENEPFANILAAQLERPEFGREQAAGVLQSLFGKSAHNSARYPQAWFRRVAIVVENNLKRFQELGVNPEQILWAPALAETFPTLHAAVESWRLAGTAPIATSRPRASRL